MSQPVPAGKHPMVYFTGLYTTQAAIDWRRGLHNGMHDHRIMISPTESEDYTLGYYTGFEMTHEIRRTHHGHLRPVEPRRGIII